MMLTTELVEVNGGFRRRSARHLSIFLQIPSDWHGSTGFQMPGETGMFSFFRPNHNFCECGASFVYICYSLQLIAWTGQTSIAS